MHEITIRACESIDEWRECVNLQSRVWGYSDRDVYPVSCFAIAFETRGQVFGAFADNRMVGFAFSSIGLRNNSPYLYSNMVAVAPEYQNMGIGKTLKLAQRDDGIARGFGHMEWMFDPLQPGNAKFNIVRLGVISRAYIPNAYGLTSSPLHQAIQTDRLIAEWWWNSRRVNNILAGSAPPPYAETTTVAIPQNTSIREAQAELRGQLTTLFGKGWVVVGFDKRDNANRYILSPAASVIS